MSEYFYKQIVLRAPDDVPIFSFPNTILMQERPQPKQPVVLGDEDDFAAQVPVEVTGMLGYLMRWPHLVFDAIGAFEDMKEMEPDLAFHRIKEKSDLYINSWRGDNIRDVVIKAPVLTSPRKRAAFIGLCVNQFFAAGFMFSGKENTTSSYRLWTLRQTETEWREAPESLSFPSHNGVGLLNGGYKLFVFSKRTLRCIDCMSTGEPFAVWETAEIPAENPALAATYMCGIRGGFGRVFLETFDKGILLFDETTGAHMQTILPEIVVISIACSQEVLLVGSDNGTIEAYGREKSDNEELKLLGRFQYGGEMKTKSGKTLTIEKKPVVQLIAQNSKLCFAMGRTVVMEEKHPQMKQLRVLESLPVVTLCMAADYVLTVSPDGSVRMCFFGEKHCLFERKYSELVGIGTWRHNQEYTSGTFAVFNVLFPSGNMVRLSPAKLIEPSKEENKENVSA